MLWCLLQVTKQASWLSKGVGGLLSCLAFSGNQLVSLCKFPVKHRDLAVASAWGHASCSTPVPKYFTFFCSQKHQLLWDANRGSLFQCLPSIKLAAVIKIKQMRKWLSLPSGIFIKMKICDCFRLKRYLKI